MVLDTVNKISDFIEKVTNYFLAFAFASMTIVYFSSIIARFVFESGIFWAEEYTRYMNVSMVMIGAATLAKYNSHTNISALEEIVKGTAKKFVIIFQQLFTIVFFSIASVIGFQFAKKAKHVSANMKLPMGVMYNVMAIAFVLLAFQAIVMVLNLLKSEEENI